MQCFVIINNKVSSVISKPLVAVKMLCIHRKYKVHCVCEVSVVMLVNAVVV